MKHLRIRNMNTYNMPGSSIFFHNLFHPPGSCIMWWPVMAIGSSEPVKEWEAFKADQQNTMGTWADSHGRAWVKSNTNVGWNTGKLIFLDRLDLCQSWVCKILLTGHHLCHPCSSMEPRWRRLAEASSDTATDMSLCCNQRTTWSGPATKQKHTKAMFQNACHEASWPFWLNLIETKRLLYPNTFAPTTQTLHPLCSLHPNRSPRKHGQKTC